MQNKTALKFHNTSFFVLLAVCCLMPIMFLPSTWAALGAVKGVVLSVGAFLAFGFWLIAQFIEGSIKIPKSKTLALLGGWAVFSFASALLSVNSSLSLWGRGFSSDSLVTTVSLVVITFLVSLYTQEQKKLVRMFLVLFSVTGITLLLQVILFAFKDVSFVAQLFGHISSGGTIVGTWVDFSYFAVFVFITSLLMYELLAPNGFFKKIALSFVVLTLLVLIFLNLKIAWLIGLVAALIIFVYKTSVDRTAQLANMQRISEDALYQPSEYKSDFPYMSFISLLVGLFFLLSSSVVSGYFSRLVGVSFNDIRPSFGTTVEVVKDSIRQSPLFGNGAGTFSDLWDLHRPLEVNQTPFWNTSFGTGFNTILTMAATNGLFAILALLAGLISALILGFKLFGYSFADRFTRFISVTSFVVVITFVSFLLINTPGFVMLSLGFIYIGLLVGASGLVGRTSIIEIRYLKDPRMSFISILGIVALLILIFAGVFFSVNRFIGVMLFNRAVASPSVEVALGRLNNLLAINRNDIYYRTYASLVSSEFSRLANVEGADQTQLQALYTQAVAASQQAVVWHDGSAINWLSLSQLYQLAAGGEDKTIYEQAKEAAEKAFARNPKNPVLELNNAQIALTQKDSTTALAAIERALVLKPDYFDAYLLRAQIQSTEGNTTPFIENLTAYIQKAPNDSQGYIALAQVYAQQKKYDEALGAIVYAQRLSPSDLTIFGIYINILEQAGEKQKAIDELEIFKGRFPEVTGVEEKITELRNSATVIPEPEISIDTTEESE